MPRHRGRGLEQVRRYDLFKLAVALLLFIAWLFFTERVPEAPTDPAGSAAGSAADPATGPLAAALPARLRIESVDGRIRLEGGVPDEVTRTEYVAAVRAALGRRDRVDDGLDVVAGAGRPGWLAHVGPAIAALAGHEGVSATIYTDQVVLEGSVADEGERTGLADEVTAAFGAPFTVVNRLAIVVPEAAAIPAAAGTGPASGGDDAPQVVPARQP